MLKKKGLYTIEQKSKLMKFKTFLAKKLSKIDARDHKSYQYPIFAWVSFEI